MGATVRYLYACSVCYSVRALKSPLKAGETMNCSACHHGAVPEKLEILSPIIPGTTTPDIVESR